MPPLTPLTTPTYQPNIDGTDAYFPLRCRVQVLYLGNSDARALPLRAWLPTSLIYYPPMQNEASIAMALKNGMRRGHSRSLASSGSGSLLHLGGTFPFAGGGGFVIQPLNPLIEGTIL